MRLIGWILLIACPVISIWTFFDNFEGSLELNRIGLLGTFIGFVAVAYTRRLTLDEGEILHYKVVAQAGENISLLNSESQTVKIAVTNKGIRFASVFTPKADQALLPLSTIVQAERLGPLSARVTMRSDTDTQASIRFKFAFWATNRFLSALQATGISVVDRTKVAGSGGMDI